MTHLDGEIDVDRLVEAFDAVVASNATLRLTIAETDEASVVASPPRSTEVIDLPRSATRAWADQRVVTPIDAAAAVYDSVIIRHDDGTCSWYLCLHHVATDATSSALVFRATAEVYHGGSIDLADLDAAPPTPSKRRQRAIDFWADRAAAPIVDSLYRPIDRRTTDVVRHDVAPLDQAQVQQALDEPYSMISRDLAWTAFLITGLAVHLHRVSGADRFAIGLPVHNRTGAARQRVVGPLMEVYPVDITIDPADSFASLHARIAKQILTVVGHALPDVGAVASDVSGIVNVIPRGDFGSFGSIPTSTQWVHSGAGDPYHLLGVQLSAYSDGDTVLQLDVNGAAADAGQQQVASDHFRSILQAMIGDPDQSIVGYSLLGPTEVDAVRAWGSGAELTPGRFTLDPRTPRSTGSVVDRLSVALANGSRPALIDGDVTMTGRELWSRSAAVAGSLTAAGIGRGDRVGVEIARSADAVIAILGVLRAGASYVPIDPAHPESRRTDLSDRAGVAGVLTDLDGIDPAATLDEAPPISAEDEAYVLFTSGSTGEPKGVPISHGGLADYLAFAAQSYLGPKQRRPVAPLFTSLGFDLTVTSLFLPLIAGGTLVVIGDDGVPGLRSVAARSDLTWMTATPSHLEVLSRLLPPRHRVSTLVVGGEAFPARLAKELTAGHAGLEIFNEYGPTEAVVGCMIHRFVPSDSVAGDVPIGGPAAGINLRIVDRGGHDVPRGVAGELLISSAGLSAGYLGQPADTAPFHCDGDARWYASGDVVRIAGSSDAVFLGRVDDQIKLNGVRLEPAEVATALETHPDVARAVVRLWAPEAGGRPMLAAWIERANAAGAVEPAALRAFVLSRLTPPQVPSAIAVVDELPFNNNGKLDADALPNPERVRFDSAGPDAADALDPTVAAQVRRAWDRVLGLSEGETAVSSADDFFVLGGDSLAALEMTAHLSDALATDISEALVFSVSSFGDYTAAVAALDGTAVAVGPRAEPGRFDLSPGEQAMLFEHRSAPDSPRYNIGRRYVVHGPVDSDRLRRAGEQVVARHAPLHLTFGAERRVLRPDQALHFSTPTLDDHAPMPDDISRAAADALYRAPFDLENGPLVRLAVHQLTENRTAIVVVTHHISGDAGSLDRFWNDLDGAYGGASLEPLTISYADHAAWQRERDHGAAFWRDLWDQPVTTDLGLPGAAGQHAGGYVEVPASFGATALRQGPGRTPTATVLAATAELLDRHHRPAVDERPGRYAIGLTASVREHPSSEPMVGYFLNTLPLVVEVGEGHETASDLASGVSELLARALPHRSHPFAEMVAEARRAGRQLPVPEVLLAVEDLAEARLGGVRVDHEVIASGEAVAPATIFVQIRGERVDLGLEFAGSALDRTRALLLLEDLDQVVARALGTDTADDAARLLPSASSSVLRGSPAASNASLMADILDHVETGRLAARCGSSPLTWEALGRRSAVLAEQLRLNGVGAGDRVVVSLTRSVDLLVAVLAASRVGATYVPLDPTYPAERRQLILKAAAPSLAIVDGGSRSDLIWVPSITVPGDRASEVDFVDHEWAPDDPAYVIFTSGSTGVPKGVEVTHGQLATSTRARDGVYGRGPDRFLLLSSIGFDSSIVGLFWTLLAGGEIVIPTEAEAHDPDALLRLMAGETVSHVLMVPTLYRALLERGSDAEHWPAVAIVAGEACSGELVALHHELRPTSDLWNEYGPTEATVWATAHQCHAEDGPVPIGGPIPGTWCAVVDDAGNPVPLGAAGELLIGGAGVVSGYLGRAGGDDSPFSEHPELGWSYRTGDAATVGVDATGEAVVWFRGRLDEQLNVGGVRLEPAEVERVLEVVDGVSSVAVVIGTGSDGRAMLVAHVAGVDVDGAALRAAATAALPGPSRPHRYVIHAHLPTTPHGKVDRNALAAIELADEVADRASVDLGPLTSTEQRVLELFRRNVRSEIGPDDGFFDAGGDSLAALSLAMELEEEFDTAFSVTTLLSEPTARAVAAQLESVVPANDSSVTDAGAKPTLVEWIRTGAADSPVLVLLAPGSGHLIGYEPLIGALDDSVPILGVRLPGYDGKQDPVPSVVTLANTVGPLLDVVLSARAEAVGHGGVVLFGGSSGGLLAWELQHRAEDAGAPFDAVVMQDTVHPDWRREQAAIGIVDDMRQRYEQGGLQSVVTELYGRGERKLDRWRRQRRSNAQAASTGAELPAVVAQRMFDAANRAVEAYRVPPLSSEITFFAASTTETDATVDRWSTEAGALIVQTFVGDHFGENGITAAGNVAPVAAALQTLLRDLAS